MGEKTGIAWTDATFNPWIGCQRVSPGCENCYAEAFAHRRTNLGVKWGPEGTRRVTSTSYWTEPIRWNRACEREGRRMRVFCASLADVLEDRPELVAPRVRLIDLIERTPCLDWQLLTKRPENIERLLHRWFHVAWPRNVWMGTTAEDQKRLDQRWEYLAHVPAPIRFLSCEPLLERVELRGAWPDWVIIGGESGYGARPFELSWAMDLELEAAQANAAVFLKQLGGKPTWQGQLLRDLPTDHPWHFAGKDRAGADPSEWPRAIWSGPGSLKQPLQRLPTPRRPGAKPYGEEYSR